MSKTIEVKGVFDPSDLRESSKKLQSAIEQDAALSNSTIEEAAQLLEFAGLWFEQNQDKIYTTVGADGNPPAPSKIDNSQRDVAAGPVPADQPDNAQACITRPDLDELEFQRQTWLSCSGMNSNSWQFYLGQQLAHTIAYIQHLEHQLTVAQNQNNLSLSTLRAERDKLRAAILMHQESANFSHLNEELYAVLK